MTGDARQDPPVLGRLIVRSGSGVVRMQDRFAADVDDVWEALTEPDRLERWLGTFSGDLAPGGRFRARYHSSGWEGVGRVEACEPPVHFRVTTRADDATVDVEIDVTLAADGDHTVLVSEHRGLPVDMLPGYGAGIQVHVEDLAAHLSGRGRSDSDARMSQLFPRYVEVDVEVG